MTSDFKRVTAVLAVEALVVAALLTIALDVRAHASVQDVGGVNVWGYRGPVAHHRQPNEIRIAVVGGTRAFGWGEPSSALTSYLRQTIMLTTDRPGQPLRPVVAINLARLGALPDTYPATLAHYGYLRPDYVCLYDDLGERGAAFDAQPSAVFALTGYSPILPLVLREKGMAWRYGDVGAGYGAAAGAPQASIARRSAGRALEAVGDSLAAVDRGGASLLAAASSSVTHATVGYADAMIRSIDAAHASARGVVVVLSPAETPRQAANRRDLLARLGERAGAGWLRVVDLDGEPSLRAPAMRIDGWNYGSAAIVRTAELIAPALVSLIASN